MARYARLVEHEKHKFGTSNQHGSTYNVAQLLLGLPQACSVA
jgi:hypothetical protein